MAIPVIPFPYSSLFSGGGSDDPVVDPVVETPPEEDFSFLDNLFLDATDEDTTDYSYLFDSVTDLTPSMPDTGIGSFDVSDLFGDTDYDDYSYLFDDDYSYTPGVSFDAQNIIDNLFGTDSVSAGSTGGGIEDILSTIESEPDTGPFGGTLGPTLRNFFLGSEDDPGILEQILLGKASSKGGGRTGGAAGLLTGGDGGILSSPLLKLILANYLSKRDEGPSAIVPIGQQAFGAGGQGLSSMPDYRVFNIQPALMPGVAYANAPPPEMKHGGVHGAGKDDGPGDITLARLEPGEFVMTRKATENLGARNLYKLMKQAERMG